MTVMPSHNVLYQHIVSCLDIRTFEIVSKEGRDMLRERKRERESMRIIMVAGLEGSNNYMI